MSGPEFLLAYVTAYAFALAVLGVARLELHRLWRQAPNRPLELDELAYLAGGRTRVVQTSVARLVAAGALRPSRGHHVTAVSGATATGDLDRAVLERAGRRPPRTVVELESALRGHPAVDAIVAGVDLIDPMNQPRTTRVALLAASPAALVIVIGLVRLSEGLAAGNPVGFLVLALLVSVPVLIKVVNRVREPAREWAWGGRHPLVRAGNYTLREAGTPAGSAAVLVALGGLGSYPDADLRDALLPPPPKRTETSAAADTSAGSLGLAAASSCGGGGGCGGCGGCGG